MKGIKNLMKRYNSQERSLRSYQSLSLYLQGSAHKFLPSGQKLSKYCIFFLQTQTLNFNKTTKLPSQTQNTKQLNSTLCCCSCHSSFATAAALSDHQNSSTMDSESYSAARFRSTQRRFISRSDLYFGERDEVDVNDELKAEFLCPFCAEEFDVVGLCCHFDEEHPVEVKNGVCPVCSKRVGMDLVSHLTSQHGSLLKVQRRRRFRRGGSNSTFSMLRKELRDGNLQSLLGGSFISSSTEPDPLLTSFISNRAAADDIKSIQSHSSHKVVNVRESSTEEFLERNWEHHWF